MQERFQFRDRSEILGFGRICLFNTKILRYEAYQIRDIITTRE